MSLPIITLNFCGKERFTNPSLELVSEQLQRIGTDDDQFLILQMGDDFIQSYVSETVDGIKLYTLEYKDSQNKILYEAEGTFEFDKALEIFQMFLAQDDSFKRKVAWVDSGFPMAEENGKSSFKSKVYFVLILIAAFVVYSLLKIL